MAEKHRTNARRSRLRVGQRVILRVGGRRIPAILIEDRGPIGVGGRRLWRIREANTAAGEQSPREYEVPADELTPTAAPAPANRVRGVRRGDVRPSVR